MGACRSSEPADAGEVEIAARSRPSEDPAKVEVEVGTDSETGETGESSGDSEASGESESGDSETGGGAGARLCSRPYSLSGTPGKGASLHELTAEAYADRTRELRRGFDVSVDRGERQLWTTKQGVEFDGLDPARRHTIMISAAGGKRIRKLVLDFGEHGSEDLCLGYSDFYGTWQLRALRSGQRCGDCVTR